MPGDTCPLESDLQAFLTGRLVGPAFDVVATHLEHCPGCQDVAERMDEPAPEGMRLLRHAPPPAPPVAPGSLIGPYLVIRGLGQGGMGIVYLARHVGLGRDVALKVMKGGFNDAARLARFETEAKTLARLAHPNVVQVFDSGNHEGSPYFVMELAEGGTLAEHTQTRPVPPRQAASWVEIMARAVHFAHQHEVIHRDLKPANILLAADGTLKVSDFGLARWIEGGDLRTVTNQILGTPDYMAPEQASGARVTTSVDVWALGAILYELLTGRTPFPSDTPLHTLARITQEDPVPPSHLRPACGRDLETICLKCLDKHPSSRYASAQALADDLRAYLEGRPITARPIGAVGRALRWARRRPTLAAALGAIVALACFSTVAAINLQREQQRTAAAEHRRQLDLAESLLITAPAAVPVVLASLAPDAARVLPLLRDRFAHEVGHRRLRAAMALMVLGESQLEYLLEAVPTAPASECGNLVLALRAGGEEARRALASRAEGSAGTRYAILALECGEPGPAMARLAGSSSDLRAGLLEEYRTWHGDLATLPELLRSASGDFRSGLCAAIGSVDPTLLTDGARGPLIELLTDLARQAVDPGSRAMAEWALRQWQQPVPRFAEPAGSAWSINQVGMYMIDIPAGVHLWNTGDLTFVPAFHLADREVTLEQFRRCLHDPSYPAADKPSWLHAGYTQQDPPSGPVRYLSHDDMLLFCNWLSTCEGRKLCYSRDASGWHLDREAGGYRLPDEAEWEYALRAGTTGTFSFGDNPRLLQRYAQVGDFHPAPVGGRLPNRWGLFDMTGNLWEVCWTNQPGPRPFSSKADPANPLVWAARGGSYESGWYDCRCVHRIPCGHVAYATYGFRVARNDRRASLPTSLEMLTAGLQRMPGNRSLLFARSNLHAQAGRWEDAARDRGEALATDPGLLDNWLRQAPLLMLARNRPGYDRHRSEVLSRFHQVSDPAEANRVARACLLAPASREEARFISLLIERALKAGPSHPQFGSILATAALADFRSERWTQAAERISAALETPSAAVSTELRELCYLMLAMSRDHLKQNDAAQKAWIQARSLAAGVGKRVQSSEWWDAAITLVLRREAETRFRSD